MHNRGVTLRIKPVAIMSFFLLALLVRPSGLGVLFPFINTPIKYMQIASAFLISGFTIYMKRHLNLSLLVVLFYYAIIYGVSYLLRHTDPMFAEACSCISLSLYSYLMYERHGDDLIDGYSKYYLTMIIIQTLLTIAGAGLRVSAATGMFSNRNHMIRFFLPGVCFTFLNSKRKTDSYFTFSSVVCFVCFTYLILFGRSGTGKMCYIAFTVLFILFMNKPLPNWLDLFHCAMYSIVIFAFIYFFHIQYYLEFIIVNFLNRDLSFTSRVFIWERSIELIKANLLFGVGAHSTYANYLFGHTHAHQYWLQLLLQGGVLGICLIMMIYYIAGKNLRNRKEVAGASIITVTIIAYLVGGIDEALTHSEMLLPLLVIASMYGGSNEYLSATMRRKSKTFFKILKV